MTSDALTRAEARQRAELLSAVRYRVELDLTGDAATFTSTTEVAFCCSRPGASTFIDLDAAAVSRMELNGTPLPAEAFTGRRIRLRPLAAHNVLRVTASCRYQRSGVGLHRFTDPLDGRVYLHTQFESFHAHQVYACFDQPDLKAPFTLQVRAPADWRVLSNSPALQRGEAGVWRFAPTLPVPTYITALVAGPFHAVHERHHDIDLGVYCRQSLAAHLDSDEILEITRQGLDYFEQAFDYPYPFGQGGGPPGLGQGGGPPGLSQGGGPPGLSQGGEPPGLRKYDQVFVPEFNWGAMENAGCVTFSERYVFRAKVTEAARQSRAGTILHEMAHMWFGDLVTMRWWDDLWLNESFATYMGTLALAEATRFTNAWASFAHSTKAWAYNEDQLPSTHPIAADIPDTDAVRVNFDGITYAKGASVLKQLVAWVGREAFLKGLRGYFRRHQLANADLGDFLAALEEGSGRDLADWAKQWLQTAGVTTLRPTFETDQDADGRRYRWFAVAQQAPVQHPALRSHRLALGLYALRDGALTRRQRVELDVVGASTAVPALAGEPVGDLLLVNDDDLAYAKVRLDQGSLATLTGHLGHLRDPLARALCWQAAWDLTRDAELAARRWVGLVVEHAAAEDDVTVLQSLLARARAAIDYYGDPANRQAARALLARRAHRGLQEAEPGSDDQLVWARTFVASADDREDLDWIRALLDGGAAVAGLAVDTELRWHIVAALAAAGAADEDLITAELARDPTDIGARRAAAARAARPVPEAKAQAWSALLGDRSQPLATMRAVVSGFYQPGQEALLAGYADRYVEALAPTWSERDPEEALLLTEGLYPSTLVDPGTVAAADRALAVTEVPAHGRRLIVEARDQTLRALRARAADSD